MGGDGGVTLPRRSPVSFSLARSCGRCVGCRRLCATVGCGYIHPEAGRDGEGLGERRFACPPGDAAPSRPRRCLCQSRCPGGMTGKPQAAGAADRWRSDRWNTTRALFSQSRWQTHPCERPALHSPGGEDGGSKTPPLWGFRGSAVSSHPFCIRRSVRAAPGCAGCQNPGLYPSAAGHPPSTASLAERGHQRRRSAAALPSRFQPRLSFWWVLWRLLQNGAVSFPSPAAGEMEGGKEINTEGLLRAGGGGLS